MRCGALLGALALLSSTAYGLPRRGSETRWRSMADAAVAAVGGPSAAVSNPAGLAGPHRPRLLLDGGQTVYRLQSPQGPLTPEPDPALAVGASWTGLLGPLRAGVGLLQRLPRSAAAQWEVRPPMEPALLRYEGWYRRAETHVAVGLGWGAIRVGAGLAILPEVTAAASTTTAGVGSGLGISDARLELRVAPELAPSVGVQWDQGIFCVGFTWRGRRGAHLTRQLLLAESPGGSAEGTAQTFSQELRVTAHDDPWALSGGLALRPIPSLLLASQLEWERWSTLPSPAATGAATVGQEVGATPAQAVPPAAPNFGDTLSVRAGAELRVGVTPELEAELRVGYRWDPSPVPQQVGLDTFLDAPLHTATAGVGLRWALDRWLVAPLELDLGVQWARLEPTTVRKTHPTVDSFDTELSGSLLDLGLTLSTAF